MSECEHKHTGSCSPAGVYLYVQCMDCGAILNESDEGRRLRTECPGFKAERYGFGSCKHCHHDAQYHYDALAAEVAALRKDAERLRGELALIAALQAGDGSTINGPTRNDFGRAFRMAQDIARTAMGESHE